MEQVDQTYLITGNSPSYNSVYGGIVEYFHESSEGLTQNAQLPAHGDDPSIIGSPQFPEGSKEIPAQAGLTTTSVQPKPPLRKRRWFIVTVVAGCCIGIALLFVVLFPVIRAIAQYIINVAVLNIDKATIANPTNGSFTLELDGWVSHTSIFNSKIDFLEPIGVAWIETLGQPPTPIGSFGLNRLYGVNKRAYINQTTDFTITDQVAFGRFTQTMITQANFTWKLTSRNLNVQALQFPVAHGLTFNKEITLNGINNFNGNVLLKDFQMPSDAPNGINFIAVTTLTNQSPFQLDLGTVVFDLTYQGMYLGTGSADNVTISPNSNDIVLQGVLVKQQGAQNLTLLSQLFSTYLNHELAPVQAIGRSVILASDGSIISWLTDGLQSLVLDVPFQSPQPINPIQSITIGDLSLAFSEANPWSPVANSNNVTAALKLPFGFGLSIGEIQNTFNITSFDGNVAGGLSTPMGASNSRIAVLSSTDTAGTIDITIQDTGFSMLPSDYPNFSLFATNITNTTQPTFFLVGQAHAVANLSIGQLELDPIKFNVSSELVGLSGLNGCVTINSVDVVGGTTQGLSLGINVTIDNPSNLNLSVGDLTLQLYRNQTAIGNVLMPNLTLNIGHNNISASSVFPANDSPQGLEVLDSFIGHQDIMLEIGGNTASTAISSLVQAFSTLNFTSILPGLKPNLLQSANLTILNTTGHGNNTVHVSVSLANPFSADLGITQVNSNVSYLGIHLGSISSSDNWNAAGKAVTASPNLNMDLNMDPASLFTVLRALAIQAGLSTAQLDGIVQLGGYSYLPTTTSSVSRRRLRIRSNMYTGFNLQNFVDTAFKQLKADVVLEAGITVVQYNTTLKYSQPAVPINTDATLNMLLPILAQPIVQKIVDAAVLSISNLTIMNPAETSFGVQLYGALTSAGPFDATISFGTGLNIEWNGQQLGSLNMPDINIVGDVGASLNVDTTFQIASTSVITEFAKVLLTQPSFDWNISAQNLTVSAIGIQVPNITLNTKTVTLKGMNGLKNEVIINSFDLPSDDPAGGITLTIDSTITNPSQVGIELSSLIFNAFFLQTDLGPVGAVNQFTLAPLSTISLPLAGRLVKQTTPQGLADLSTVFNNFIHGLDSNVTVQGEAAGDPSVTWLNDAIKYLIIATLLPNQGKIQIIKSISLDELSLSLTVANEWNPSTSTTATYAAFQIPFNFPVDIISMDEVIGLSYNSNAFAQLAVPHGAVTTDVQNRIITIGFTNVPLAVAANQYTVFQDFLKATTLSSAVALDLSGIANADASTAVGVISLIQIDFSVPTVLQGINNFGGTASLSGVSIAGSGGNGGNQYINVPITTGLQNPSNISIQTVDVSLPVSYQNVNIGRAVINPFNLVSGVNSIATSFYYEPANANDSIAQEFLSNYLQTGNQLPLTIQGDSSSTPVLSLQPALAGVTLSTSVQGMAANSILTHVNAYITLASLVTNVISIDFDIHNPLNVPLKVMFVQADGAYAGTTYAHFDYAFPSYIIPPHGTGNSGPVPNVVLTQGATNSLGIIPKGTLDVYIDVIVQINDGGYEIPWLKLTQLNTPTTYHVQGLPIKKRMARAQSRSRERRLKNHVPARIRDPNF